MSAKLQYIGVAMARRYTYTQAKHCKGWIHLAHILVLSEQARADKIRLPDNVPTSLAQLRGARFARGCSISDARRLDAYLLAII